MVSFYQLPVQLWHKVLGHDLHFHLGHFPTADTHLTKAMRNAVNSLAARVSAGSIKRVLDVGCGWGGPGFQLARTWHSEIIGLTASSSQAEYVNRTAITYKFPVHARTIDVERHDFGDIGAFDVVWLFEVLEHIADRRNLFINLHNAAHGNTQLAIAVNCRSPQIAREELYNEFMGIQRLETASELMNLLEETGWKVLTYEDCSSLTLPTWKCWLENIAHLNKADFSEQAAALTGIFENSRQLYQRNMLQSIQIVTEYATT